MTKATILESINHLAGFKIEGHSGFGIYGNDIVCAAISTASQLTSYGIQEVVKMDANEAIREGYHHFQLHPINDPIKFMQAQVMLKTMAKVLEDIATQFPDNLSVEYKSIGGAE